MGQHRHLTFWMLLLLVLHVALVCSLAAHLSERNKRDADEDNDDNDNDGDTGFGEGIIEQYILAREEAEFELEEFYKTADPGMVPDANSDAMFELRAAREKLMKMSIPPEELEDLLEGDPGLKIDTGDEEDGQFELFKQYFHT